VNVLLRHGVLR